MVVENVMKESYHSMNAQISKASLLTDLMLTGTKNFSLTR